MFYPVLMSCKFGWFCILYDCGSFQNMQSHWFQSSQFFLKYWPTRLISLPKLLLILYHHFCLCNLPCNERPNCMSECRLNVSGSEKKSNTAFYLSTKPCLKKLPVYLTSLLNFKLCHYGNRTNNYLVLNIPYVRTEIAKMHLSIMLHLNEITCRSRWNWTAWFHLITLNAFFMSPCILNVHVHFPSLMITVQFYMYCNLLCICDQSVIGKESLLSAGSPWIIKGDIYLCIYTPVFLLQLVM